MAFKKLKIQKKNSRFLGLETKSMEIDAEKRTVTLPFSSELPVERYYGMEILSHKAGCADMSRMNDGGALLWNHDWNTQIGVVEDGTCELRADNRLWATLRFSKNPKADEVFKDVIDGIVRNVSFGYEICAIERINPGVNEMPQYLATEWKIYEISFAPVPADPTVGVGRGMGCDEVEMTVTNEDDEEEQEGEEITMNEQEKKELEAKLRIEAEKTVLTEERSRVECITKLGEMHKMQDLARELISGGKTIEQAQKAVLEKLGAKQMPIGENDSNIGLNQKEIKQFSIMRALRALADPTNAKNMKEAAFEFAVSHAASQKSGKDSRGIMIPTDILNSKGMTVGTAADGGNLVGNEFRASSFVEILRNKMITSQAGAQMLNGLTSDVTIPKQSGAGTAYYLAEGDDATASKQALAQINLSPKTLGAKTDISRKLLIQSSIDVENMVKNDLAAIIAIAIDAAALYGTGNSNQPAGLKGILTAYNSSSQEKDLTSTPTYAEIVSMESKIAALNADVNSMKYIANATMRGVLKTAPRVSGYPSFLLEGGQMNGYDFLCSNQVAIGDIWLGNWSDLIIAFFSGLDLMVDPYSLSSSGAIRVTAFQDFDIGVRHEGSFSRGNDTL